MGKKKNLNSRSEVGFSLNEVTLILYAVQNFKLKRLTDLRKDPDWIWEIEELHDIEKKIIDTYFKILDMEGYWDEKG